MSMNRRTLLKLLPFLPPAVWALLQTDSKKLPCNSIIITDIEWKDSQHIKYLEYWYETGGQNRIAILAEDGSVISDMISPYNKMPANYIKGNYMYGVGHDT